MAQAYRASPFQASALLSSSRSIEEDSSLTVTLFSPFTLALLDSRFASMLTTIFYISSIVAGSLSLN